MNAVIIGSILGGILGFVFGIIFVIIIDMYKEWRFKKLFNKK